MNVDGKMGGAMRQRFVEKPSVLTHLRNHCTILLQTNLCVCVSERVCEMPLPPAPPHPSLHSLYLGNALIGLNSVHQKHFVIMSALCVRVDLHKCGSVALAFHKNNLDCQI